MESCHSSGCATTRGLRQTGQRRARRLAPPPVAGPGPGPGPGPGTGPGSNGARQFRQSAGMGGISTRNNRQGATKMHPHCPCPLPSVGHDRARSRLEKTRMDPIVILQSLDGATWVTLLAALFVILCVFLGVRIVPQAQKYVIERFGRLRAVLGPGINLIVPFIDRVAHRVSILERQLPNASQDAITADNVLVKVETSVFYRILEPEKTVYRIRDVDGAIATTVAGIVRAEIGKMELDH